MSTKIQWAKRVWNPVTGCNKVSPGCARCYAERIDHRFDHDKTGRKPWAFPSDRGGREITLHPERMGYTLKIREPTRFFVNSMSDLFHKDVPASFLVDIFAEMAVGERHTYMILTKREDRMKDTLNDGLFWEAVDQAVRWDYILADDLPSPLPNVWVGVSVENQYWANRRIPKLLSTRAAVRFVSVEPLLKPVDLTDIDYTGHLRETMYEYATWRGLDAEEVAATVPGAQATLNCLSGDWFDGWDSGSDGNRLDWAIVGGESGPGARRMDLDWTRRIVQDCAAASVPCFVKQLGGTNRQPPFESWPEDLKVRQFPNQGGD